MEDAMASETNQKFRPAFSKQEIQYLIDLCNKDKRDGMTEMAFTIAARLRIFALKADLHIIAPAFTSTERQSLEDKLGMESDSPTEKRLAAFKKWKENPAACTKKELNLSMTYRYENSLLNPDEEKNYEQY
jgi:hypothetical protein